MGEVEPRVEAAEVSESGERARATLAWTWPLGADDWTYDAPAALTRTGDTWRVRWAPSLVEPSLEDGEVLDASRITPTRGDVTGAGGATLVTARPVVRVGIDRAQVRPGRGGRVRAPAGRAGRRRPRRLRPPGPGLGPTGLRRGHRLPARRRAGVAGRAGPDPRRGRPARRAAAGADQGVRRTDPRHRRAGHRRDGQGAPRHLPGRRRRRPLRAPGPLRRAAAGHARHPGAGGAGGRRRTRSRGRRTPPASCSGWTRPPAGRCARPSTRTCRRTPSGSSPTCGPASALVALRPSTGAVLAAANGPGNDGYNLATFGQLAPGLDVQERDAAWRCCATG